MTKIFISYRRADSRKDAGRIYDRIVDAFGKENVFKDVDNIPFGADFRGVLAEAVSACDVLLAIIGPQWLMVKDEKGKRRLDNPGDFVRIEIETALTRDSALVIPVLVDSAPMPSEADLPHSLGQLAYKNAVIVRDDPDFHHDVGRLIESLLQRGKPGERHQIRTRPFNATPGFDIHEAISSYFRAFDVGDWDTARALLAEIRRSGKTSRVFNVDAQEKAVWEAIEQEEREKEYYIVRLMAQRDEPEQALESLHVFWESFPGYDPDNLAETLRTRISNLKGKSKAKPAEPTPSQMRQIAELSTRFEQAEKARDWNQVIELGERIVGMDSKNTLVLEKTANAYRTRGKRKNETGQYDEAIVDFNRAIELDPHKADYYRERGVSYHQRGEYDEAIADISRAIELDPFKADYYFERGVNNYFNGQCDQTIADISRAIELDPHKPNYYYERGKTYHHMGQYDQAIADKSRAIELNPHNAAYYCQRGVSYHETGQYDQTMADFKRAIELDPFKPDYYFERGKSYHQIGQYVQAIADKSRAIELDPVNADYFYSRWRTYSEMGKRADARQDLERAAKLGHKNAEKKLNRLDPPK